MSGETWQLGPLRVEAGRTLRGVYQVDLGRARIGFPIALINGTEPDPVLLVTSGMDGDEYAGVEAALRLIDTLDPASVAGRVMVCPVLDPLSFEAMQGQNPLDGLILRQVLPGDLEGKPTQRLAHFVYQTFILNADAWLALGAAEPGESCAPLAWTFQSDDEFLNTQNRILLRQCGAPLGLLQPPAGWDPGPVALTASTAVLGFTAGVRGRADPEAVEAHRRVIDGALASMSMIAGATAPSPPAIYPAATPLLAESGGLWYARVRAGELVKSGQAIGEIRRLDGGAVLQAVSSPLDGVVLAVRIALAVRPRQRLALLAAPPQHKSAENV